MITTTHSHKHWTDEGGHVRVEECSHAVAFDAYIDARRRCVLRGCPYLLVDAETGSTVAVLTVKQCLHQYGVEGDFPA